MFEKYHLIHFEITKPLTENCNERIYTDNKEVETLAGNNMKWSEVTNASDSTHCTSYCLTGSFDILLSMVSNENATEALYLQSFNVMNNTRQYFTRRSDYNSLLLSYTYSGEGCLIYNNESYTLRAGLGFIIDCRKPHEYFSTGDNWEHMDIHMWGDKADSFYQHFSSQNIVTISYPTIAFNDLVERLLDACTTFSDHRNLFVSNSLTNIICAFLDHAEKEGNSSIPDTYKYVIHYMECNYMNPLSLDSLSSFVNISKYYFTREFKKYTGFTPNDYLIELKIKHTCVLLKNSNLSIEQVAEDVGMNNMSNFIYQFKKRTGMTPSAFRKCK